jgi:hypothetical protein
MQIERDFYLVPLDAWNVLHECFGGGPQITRRAIEDSRGDAFVTPRLTVPFLWLSSFLLSSVKVRQTCRLGEA